MTDRTVLPRPTVDALWDPFSCTFAVTDALGVRPCGQPLHRVDDSGVGWQCLRHGRQTDTLLYVDFDQDHALPEGTYGQVVPRPRPDDVTQAEGHDFQGVKWTARGLHGSTTYLWYWSGHAHREDPHQPWHEVIRLVPIAVDSPPGEPDIRIQPDPATTPPGADGPGWPLEIPLFGAERGGIEYRTEPAEFSPADALRDSLESLAEQRTNGDAIRHVLDELDNSVDREIIHAVMSLLGDYDNPYPTPAAAKTLRIVGALAASVEPPPDQSRVEVLVPPLNRTASAQVHVYEPHNGPVDWVMTGAPDPRLMIYIGPLTIAEYPPHTFSAVRRTAYLQPQPDESGE